LLTVASQFAQLDELQLLITQLPVEHDVFAFDRPWHGWFWPLFAHPPQFCTLRRSASQPVLAVPSQSE
jgi:hypothetical protein